MSTLPSHHPKYRTKLCRNFTNGNCQFGQKCSFLHPMPNTLSSSLAQYLFNWNVLLPHFLALSGQQGRSKEMSPLHSQGPQLVDEDPSPTSLLLSTSDSTSSEQMPTTRRFNRRKRYPCRQFIRSGGWCPAGARCRFYHDVTALPGPNGQKLEQAIFETDMHRDGGRTISGGVFMGVQTPSPPVIEQAHSEPPRYTEAELAGPYQPMYWPNNGWQPYPPYYAAVPATTAVPVPATMISTSAMPHNVLHPPPQEPEMNLPLGAYEINGTTYFPTQATSVSAPAPAPMPSVHPVPYGPMLPAHPLYAGYYDLPNAIVDGGLQTSFNPFSSDPMVPSDLPAIAGFEGYHTSPLRQDDLGYLLSPPARDAGPMHASMVAHEPEFPYRPRENQQAGHARRISINIKKHDRANSG